MKSLAISILAIVALWLVGLALGFRISVIGSILLSVGLTLVVNLILGGMRHRRDVRLSVLRCR